MHQLSFVLAPSMRVLWTVHIYDMLSLQLHTAWIIRVDGYLDYRNSPCGMDLVAKKVDDLGHSCL